MSLTFNEYLILGKRAVHNADAFVSAGNITINSEGIISADSQTSGAYSVNYARTAEKIDTTSAETAKIEYEFKVTRKNTSGQTFLLNYSSTAINGAPNIQLYQDGIMPWAYGTVVSGGKYTDYSAGDTFKIIFELNSSGSNTGTLYKNGTKVLTYNFTNTNWRQNNYIYLWGKYDGNGAADINVNALKIYVDGVLILSGSKLVQPEWQAKPFKFDAPLILGKKDYVQQDWQAEPFEFNQIEENI